MQTEDWGSIVLPSDILNIRSPSNFFLVSEKRRMCCGMISLQKLKDYDSPLILLGEHFPINDFDGLSFGGALR